LIIFSYALLPMAIIALALLLFSAILSHDAAAAAAVIFAVFAISPGFRLLPPLAAISFSAD